MGRRKKEQSEGEKGKDQPKKRALHGDAKRVIVAIVLGLFSFLAILSFLGFAARLGSLLDGGIGQLFGFGKWLFPVLLLGLAVILFRRKESEFGDMIKITALLAVFFSALAFIHLLLGDTTEELLRVARRGDGGGYFGFGLAAALLYTVGKTAAGTILIALILIGLIAAFNISLYDLLDRVRGGKEEPTPESGADIVSLDNVAPAEALSDVAPEPPVDALSLDPDPAVPLGADTLPDEAERLAEMRAEQNITKVFFPDEAEPTPVVPSVVDGGADFSPEGGATLPAEPHRPRRKHRWEFPRKDLLESSTNASTTTDTERAKEVIRNTLKYFGIEVTPKDVNLGPTVIQYTFEPAPGVHLSRITALSNNLALALAATAVRIEAPIPGQALIGIEVPRDGTERVTVRLRNFLDSPEFRSRKSNLTIVLGEGPGGKAEFADLTAMPHLLIAGRTNSGKSVCIDSILTTLLYQNNPEELKLILVDPKRVTLTHYRGIPHLLTDVVVEPKKVVNVLNWTVGEMTRRYKILERMKTRNIEEFHEARSRGERMTVTDERTGEDREEPLETMPYIVVVVDEMADLMVSNQKEIEPHIVRLAQLSRAVGIHLIIATQRPSVEVVTGLIKTNFPTRIAFQVSSQIDSRTVLDAGGAEKLIGKGDMLYSPPEGGGFERIQGVFVSTSEVERVTDHWRAEKRKSGAEEEIGEDITTGAAASGTGGESGEGSEVDEDLVARAQELVILHNRPSTTFLQRMLGLGYPKADRVMGVLEERGIVSAPQGNRRTLLVNAGAHPVAGALQPAPADEKDLSSKIPAILPPGSENR